MAASTRDFGEYLQALQRGESSASSRLFALVYEDLRRIARANLGRPERDRTLNTTALVHESYLRLFGDHSSAVESKHHFLNLASRVMRQVLCDYARERLAEKRGGDQIHTALTGAAAEVADDAIEMLELDELLNKLEARYPRAARVFECRYFAGLSETECSEALGLSLRTVQREWNASRGWLAKQMDG